MEALPNNMSYEFWLLENQENVIDYVKQNDVNFKDVQMTTRAYNTLRMNGKNYMSDIIFYTTEEINGLEKMCEEVANEILMFKKNYLRNHKKGIIAYVISGVVVDEDKTVSSTVKAVKKEKTVFIKPEVNLQPKRSPYFIKLLLSDKLTKEKIIEFVKSKNIVIRNFEISARPYNALRRGDVEYLHQAIAYYPDGFDSFRNMGVKGKDEICAVIENYVYEQYDAISIYIEKGEILPDKANRSDPKDETDPYKLTVLELLEHPLFKDKATKFLKENNIPVQNMGLGVRAVNAFIRADILSFYDALSIYPYELSTLKNVGEKSIKEINDRMEYHISKIQNSVLAYCSGDLDAIYSDELVYDTIMSCFEDIGFEGVYFNQIEESFSKDVNEARIKSCIEGLIKNEKLKCIDGKLYCVYPSIVLVLDESGLSDSAKKIVDEKLSGKTFEAIGQDRDITRERARQKFENNLKKLRDELQIKYGCNLFGEDYYKYLFSTYEVIKELWLDFIGISEKSFGYLSTVYSKGKASIEDALTDNKLDINIKLKIQNYLNRNKLLIDGVLIKRQRQAIEDYALSKLCLNEMSYEDFAFEYNELLKKNGIGYDEKLYYTQEVRNTRKNRLAESKQCFWKQGEKIRYYNILSRDYSELLDTLNLGSFVNVEISTLKFFNDYPTLMAKYDIRDQYELHNLLKKIVDVGQYNDMVFSRQPMIKFGEFDRVQAIYDIIVAFSPISTEDLAEYLYSEYGYDKITAQSGYFQPFNKYFHKGVYNVAFKQIPLYRIPMLESSLTNEFYFISEIKEIYKKLFPAADMDEINPRSLKAMGYNVFATYVLKSFPTAEAYFKHLLTENEVFFIKNLNQRYGNIRSFGEVAYDLRRNYDILLLENGKYITFSKLEKMGINKSDIKNYCDEVYKLVGENEYFTIHSLSKFYIDTKLDTLGFDDAFLAGILAMSGKFSYTYIFGQIVLYKGTTPTDITKKSFLLSQISKYKNISFDELKEVCDNTFGVKIPDKYEIFAAISGTEFYYDKITDRLYQSEDVYYSTLSDLESEM